MDDQHWLLSTTLAGFIFVAVFFSSVWALTGHSPRMIATTAFGIPENLKAGVSETLALLAVVGAILPLLGMVVRVLSIMGWLRWQLRDEARKVIGALSREALLTSRCSKIGKSRTSVSDKINEASDDSLFIWFALAEKKDVVVQWARNRRHYQYLGENCFTATLAATMAALVVAAFHCFQGIKWWPSVGCLLILLLWMAGLLGLRCYMKRAVDSMELAWVCQELDPDVRQKVLDSKNVENLCLSPPSWKQDIKIFLRCIGIVKRS